MTDLARLEHALYTVLMLLCAICGGCSLVALGQSDYSWALGLALAACLTLEIALLVPEDD